MDLSIILTILLGSLSGLFGGALGQSGAEIMLPGLLIMGIVPNFKIAAGTVLLAIVPPISILAVYEYYVRKQIQFITSFILFICYFITAYFGAYITRQVNDKTLEFVTGIYFLIISIFFFWNSYTGTFGEKVSNEKHIYSVSRSTGFKNLFK